jgi:hypothetical protein
MHSLQVFVGTIPWSFVGNALVLVVILVVLVSTLKRIRMPFREKVKARRAQEREARRRKDLLVNSVRTHLMPALIQRGFEALPAAEEIEDRKNKGTFPFGRLRRVRPDGRVDQVQIEFSTYARSAFRINACAIPKEGMMTDGGHKTAEECLELGVHDLETHARPWLRPMLGALRIDPVGQWFSVWHWPFLSPKEGEYERLALRAVAILPELEFALRDGKLGPHIRRFEMKPLPAEVLERIRRFNAEREMKEK